MIGQANHDELRLRSLNRGLHLKSSVLCLDAQIDGQLSFLSSALEINKAITMKVVATEETTKIIQSFGIRPNSLICQYNRPFSLGKLSMELLPSGHCLGGALLYLEGDFGSLLYAPLIQNQRISVFRSLQLKKADTLVMRADQPWGRGGVVSRNKEKERLLESLLKWVKSDIWPQIFCLSMPIAQELCKLLSEHGLSAIVHPSIYKINKIYDDYGCDLGSYFALNSFRRSQKKVIIYPASYAKKHRYLTLSARPSFIVLDQKSDQKYPLSLSQHQEIFYLSQASSGPELAASIDSVAPKRLYFFGSFAKEYASYYRDAASEVMALYPDDQPTLF